MVGWIVLIVLVLAGIWAVSIFNGLVRRRNLVAEGWSGIETQLKRRADLIPNLVESVKGYAAHERGTLDELTRLRAGSRSQDVTQRAQTEGAISAALGRIMAVAEAYPDLKASANFQSLQNELAEVENQIQLARRYYNGAVRDFNTGIGQFPSNLIANFGGFKPAPFFEIENAADRDVPKVSFG
jgi:LemA protein